MRLFVLLGLLTAGFSSVLLSATRGGADWDVVLSPSNFTGGILTGERILLPKGVVLELDEAAWIIASDRLLIEGDIAMGDADSEGIDAPELRLEAGRQLTVRGTIRGGAGWSYPEAEDPAHLMKPGGRGGDIQLMAPDLLVWGLVASGPGGTGGPGGPGGPGGEIVCIGGLLSDHGLTPAERKELPARVTYFSEAGGLGGIGSHELGVGPGDSGDTGDIHFQPYPQAGAPAGEGACADGDPGLSPGRAEGQDGKEGRPGLDGTEESPDGMDGADGGAGADITGVAAGNGGDGGDCCGGKPGQGGNGGAGGVGGAAIAGEGGDGGNGGDAFKEGTEYLGAGGDGGDSGNGGSATGGTGGDGGDGGDGDPAGVAGDAGAGGEATPGQPGTPGAPGSGSPDGQQGQSGTLGSIVPGAPGDAGNQGALCP